MTEIISKIDSLLPSELHGLALVSGLRGSGKSYLASCSDLPENICYFDFESKNQSIHSQLNFGEYHSVLDETANAHGPDFTHIHVFDLLDKMFKKLESNKFTVVVLDNIEPMQNALLAKVKKFPTNYGIDPVRAQSGSMGGAWPGVSVLMSGYMSLLHAKGIRLIICISHLKAVWTNTGPVPNKYKPVGIDRLHELSVLSLVTFYAENAPVPSALVMKEMMGSISFNRETRKHEIKRRLPLRLPVCTFEAIHNYLKSPADLREPKAGEVPTEDEVNPYSDKFTKDQLRFMVEMARASGRDNGDVTLPKVAPKGSQL